MRFSNVKDRKIYLFLAVVRGGYNRVELGVYLAFKLFAWRKVGFCVGK